MGRDIKEFVKSVVDRAGSDVAVARIVGFSDGSRVGLWRMGRGRPSELACIKLARYMSEDPLEILTLAGYAEMAELLRGHISSVVVPEMELYKAQLQMLRGMIDLSLKAVSEEPKH